MGLACDDDDVEGLEMAGLLLVVDKSLGLVAECRLSLTAVVVGGGGE
jgi:hypothetical protein